MCGLFGYFNKYTIPNLENINIHTMLHHRGPDDLGWLLFDGEKVQIGKTKIPRGAAKLFLLHKRLSVIDTSELGWQPMVCHNERYYLIFNGEIYNYLELKNELQDLGVTFRSSSDSEVLLKAYSIWGKNVLTKITGMFAFAIFDKLQKKMLIARDFFGIKPLYYYHDAVQFIFASEIKALLNHLPQKNINPQRAYHYLRSGTTDFKHETLINNVFQLPAAHFIEFNLDDHQDLTLQCYWEPTLAQNSHITFKDAASEVRSLFLENITLHLRSDVKMGAALSGGIDSSAIVMSARHLYPTLTLNTFSYIPNQSNISEEKWIDVVNSASNAQSTKVFAKDSHEMISDLENLITLQDEPFGSTSIYAQHRIFQAASEKGVKVMLDGQGADEMLGGYTFYIAARFVSLLKQFQFKQALKLLQSSRKYVANSVLLQSIHYLLPAPLQNILRMFVQKEFVAPWMNKSWFDKNNVDFYPAKKKYGKNVLQEELLNTFCHTSLPMLLRYEDRNSMAYSVESRVPFLTPKFAQFLLTLPEHFIISANGTSKAVFRAAMKDIVPDSILNRRDKIGFATPEKEWLTTLRLWAEKILTSDYAKSLPVFNHKNLIADWNNMLANKSQFDFRYWRWINFIKWSELHQVKYES